MLPWPNKSREVRDFLVAVFPDRAKAWENGQCTECGTLMMREEFRDKWFLEEYYSTGLCQHCQDTLSTEL